MAWVVAAATDKGFKGLWSSLYTHAVHAIKELCNSVRAGLMCAAFAVTDVSCMVSLVPQGFCYILARR